MNKLITDKNISAGEYRILCYLCMRAGNQDVCYSSLGTIADDIGISLSSVKRAIPSLVKKGYIVKINRKKANNVLHQISINLQIKFVERAKNMVAHF